MLTFLLQLPLAAATVPHRLYYRELTDHVTADWTNLSLLPMEPLLGFHPLPLLLQH